VPELKLSLKPIAPFRLDLTVWALRRRPDNAIDLWDGVFYRRVLVVDGVPARLEVSQVAPPEHPRLAVTVVSTRPLFKLRDRLAATIDRMLGLRVDLSPFYRIANGDPKIGKLVERFMGVKPPRFPTVFEALINAIACQQLTVLVGLMLLNRLAGAKGLRAASAGRSAIAFPCPERLDHANPWELRTIGFSRHKAEAIISLARECVADPERLSALTELKDDEVLTRLTELRGIGRWSAQYAMLRGLGRLNVFPADDVAGQKNLHRWLGLRRKPDYEKTRRLLTRWHPYEGMLYFHFLLSTLETRGFLS
jgi:DNA-3-methyladenine glycosylase II